jgi:hypothetical protein
MLPFPNGLSSGPLGFGPVAPFPLLGSNLQQASSPQFQTLSPELLQLVANGSQNQQQAQQALDMLGLASQPPSDSTGVANGSSRSGNQYASRYVFMVIHTYT